MSTFDEEELSVAMSKVRIALGELRTSIRDFDLGGYDAASGPVRPSRTLHMLLTEQSAEARGLYLAASEAAEALERMGYRH